VHTMHKNKSVNLLMDIGISLAMGFSHIIDGIILIISLGRLTGALTVKTAMYSLKLRGDLS